jgi:hypothetical protein
LTGLRIGGTLAVFADSMCRGVSMRMRRFTTVLTVAAFGLVGAVAAQAGGNGAQTFTQIDKNVVEVDPPGTGNGNPCSGADGTLTLVYNDIFHGTINTNGSWFTGTLTGRFSFVPVDPSQPSYTGHFTSWFGDENNKQNGVEHSTMNIHHAIGSDGSTLTFHENMQATMNANGVITVSFDKARCG